MSRGRLRGWIAFPFADEDLGAPWPRRVPGVCRVGCGGSYPVAVPGGVNAALVAVVGRDVECGFTVLTHGVAQLAALVRATGWTFGALAALAGPELDALEAAVGL